MFGYESYLPDMEEKSFMVEAKISQYLDRILNKQICAIGRAANMLWLGIGEKAMIVNRRGEEVEKSTYSLHVQSTWRIVDNEKKEILLASSDFYSPYDETKSYEDFDWDVIGNNLFDRKAPLWLQKVMPISIIKYEISRWGDLLIILSNRQKIEIYVNASDDTECWRMLDSNYENEHLVMTGLGLSFN